METLTGISIVLYLFWGISIIFSIVRFNNAVKKHNSAGYHRTKWSFTLKGFINTAYRSEYNHNYVVLIVFNWLMSIITFIEIVIYLGYQVGKFL